MMDLKKKPALDIAIGIGKKPMGMKGGPGAMPLADKMPAAPADDMPMDDEGAEAAGWKECSMKLDKIMEALQIDQEPEESEEPADDMAAPEEAASMSKGRR